MNKYRLTMMYPIPVFRVRIVSTCCPDISYFAKSVHVADFVVVLFSVKSKGIHMYNSSNTLQI